MELFTVTRNAHTGAWEVNPATDEQALRMFTYDKVSADKTADELNADLAALIARSVMENA